MAKRVSKYYERQWQWHTANHIGDINRCCCGACGLYSRTWTRLKLAVAGKDALNIPKPSWCKPACITFALCFPCYGCLIARLQIKVRSFYHIDGDVIPDFCEACCYPGITIVRNEQEIILREKRRNAERQYKCHPPMIYVSQPPESNPLDSKAPPPKLFEPKPHEPKPSQPKLPKPMPLPSNPPTSMPSDSRAISPKTTAPPDTASVEEANIIVSLEQQCHAPETTTDSTKPVAMHSLEDHELVEGIGALALHKLEDDPATTIVGKFQEHILGHDPEYATTVTQVSHSLGADPTTTQRAGPSKHELGWDPVAPASIAAGVTHSLQTDTIVALQGSSKHFLESHGPLVDTPPHTTSHALENDTVTSTEMEEPLKHNIETDQLMPVGKVNKSHELGE